MVYAPNFERYSDDFDPDAGMGGAEIWVPIEARRCLARCLA
jgi:predicted transcriptional regulator YdeE